MIIQLKFTKRFYKPILSLTNVEETFSVVTKTNVQFINPKTDVKLNINPIKHVYCNGVFYYLYKDKIYTKKSLDIENTKIEPLKIPGKVFDFEINGPTLIIASKKIMLYEDGMIQAQLYGPDSNIFSMSAFENLILVLSSFDKNIRLFTREKTNHNVYECIEFPSKCVIINKNLFVVGTEKGSIFIYDVNKTKPITEKKVSQKRITSLVVYKEKNLFFSGDLDGNLICFDVKEKKEIYRHVLDGEIHHLLITRDQLLVAMECNRNSDGQNSTKSKKSILMTFDIII